MAGINQRASNAKTFFTDKNIRTMLGAVNTKPAYLIDVKPGQSRNEQIANVAKLQAIRESAGDGNKYNEAEVNEKMEALNDYLEKKAEFDSHMKGVPGSDYEKALGYFNEKFDTSVVETYENARTELVDYQIASLKDKNAAKQAHPDAAYAAGDMSRADYTKTVGKIFQKDTSVENVNSKSEKTNTSPSPTQPAIDSVTENLGPKPLDPTMIGSITENLGPKPLDPTMIGSITENLGPKPLDPTMGSATENLDPHPIQEQTQMQSVTENLEPLGDVTSDIDKRPTGGVLGVAEEEDHRTIENDDVVDERTVDPEFLDKVREQFANMDLHSKEAFDTLYEGLNTSYGEQMLELMAVEPDAIAAVKDSLDVLHNMSKEDYERSVSGDFSYTLGGVLSANGIDSNAAINRVNEFMAGKDPAELLSGKDLGVHYNEMLEDQQKAVKEALMEGKTPDSRMPEFGWMSEIHTDKYWDEKLSFSVTKEHTLGHEPETMNIEHRDEIIEQIKKDNPDIIPSKDSGIVGPGTTLEALHGKENTLPNDHTDEIVEQIAKENPELGIRPAKNSDKIGPGSTLEALYGEKAHTLPNIPKIVNIDGPEANGQSGKPSKSFIGGLDSVDNAINAIDNNVVVATNAQSEPVNEVTTPVSAEENVMKPEHESGIVGPGTDRGHVGKVDPAVSAVKTGVQIAREAAAAAIAPAESSEATASVECDNSL